jgi:hypothetical protein
MVLVRISETFLATAEARELKEGRIIIYKCYVWKVDKYVKSRITASEINSLYLHPPYLPKFVYLLENNFERNIYDKNEGNFFQYNFSPEILLYFLTS